ncbi:MAG: hypothetical protein WEF51_04700 [Chloroflexota bacterium]
MDRPIRARQVFPGRRLGDPVGIPADPGTRQVRGRLSAVSVRASVGAGAWVGFSLGLVAGALFGAAVVWFAGAMLDWQRDLAFTFGVARRLLPFGDQIGLLRDMQARWWLVIPAVGLAVGLLGAMVGSLLGGILAAAYNRSPRNALVVVELPNDVAPGAAREQHSQPAAAGTPARKAARPRPATARPVRARASRPAAREVLHSRLHGVDREE